MRFRLEQLALLFALSLTSCGAEPSGPNATPASGVNVLFIGNSLTYWNDLPSMLEGLFELGDAGSIHAESVAFGGVGLPDHWVDGRAVQRIRAGGWDVVVLQQGPSATEGRPYLLEYTPLFAEEIRAIGAEPALYMVWPAESRFFDFAGVSDSYATAAANVGGLLFPAGEAWLSAWEVDPTMELYGPDRFHPSVLGTYLAALVIYQQLSGRDPRALPPSLPNGGAPLAEQDARVLQDAAADANVRFAR